ncbi:MAG: nucleotidyltransferase [candidate division Zixibacteria bacterium]|nr:nucleotidyltransferase [candidate division Zixibacteria bacterium]
MILSSYFEKFLREIRPTDSQREDCIKGHITLRDRLASDEELKPIIVSTLLQGSYRRATAIRPKGDERSDVDVIVVSRLDKNEYQDPNKAMDLFVPFLRKYYEEKHKRQGRSFGIELSYIDLDLVITASLSQSEEGILKSEAVTTFETPEEAQDWRLVKSWVPVSQRKSIYADALMEAARKESEWKIEPLWIPDREAGEWKPTHPLEQIKWTFGKNARCNGHYVNVVKAIKWWERINHETDSPKGYPLEHLIGVCCPDSIQSVAEGVTLTLESIVKKYAYAAEARRTPNFPDHGVPQHNVFARISGEDFAKFYGHVFSAAQIAREALSVDTVKVSANKWRELFSDKFPPPVDDDGGDDGGEPKGPFITPAIKSQTGDLTPRQYGYDA